MKTKRVAARLSPLDINKIARFFNYPTIRAVIESTIELSESDTVFRAKLNELINQKRIKKPSCEY